MSRSKSNLDGNVPDRATTVLVLVDVINDLDFPNNKSLLRNSVTVAKAIAALKSRCKRAHIPAVYVNDNHGKWRSDFSAVLRHCLRRDSPGKSMVGMLSPQPNDYIVLKPKHSAFYATPFETILSYIGARNVIIAGFTTNACVLLTVGGLYTRECKLFVPEDCVAALNERDHRLALELMKKSYAVDTTVSTSLQISRLSRN